MMYPREKLQRYFKTDFIVLYILKNVLKFKHFEIVVKESFNCSKPIKTC